MPMHLSSKVQCVYTCACAGLRKKTVAPGAGGLDDHLRSTSSTDLFGSADAIVKHVLEVSCGYMLVLIAHLPVYTSCGCICILSALREQ